MRRETTSVFVLWAANERYRHPNIVRAWSGGYNEAGYLQDDEIEAAKQWFLDFGDEIDGPWTFWTTTEAVRLPTDEEITEAQDEQREGGRHA